jgi:hypothetical protein
MLLGVGAVLFALLAVFIAMHGIRSLHRVPQWTREAIRLKLNPTEDASAGAYYDRTAHGPLPLAAIVRDMRREWPKESNIAIHHAALEVGSGLLHRSDIEAGELLDGKFVPYDSPAWHVHRLMTDEVKASPDLYDNERTYVFRRK